MENYELYMHRCIRLALTAKGRVFPNPLVGAIVIKDGKIIGEGYHHKFGEAHAEVNAINSVIDKTLLKDSTLIVTLEPCCHTGKTPPCTDLIIKSGIKTVVIGSIDINPLVGGKGINILKDSGINVIFPVLDKECINMNYQYFQLYKLKTKTVRFKIKWAESLDGFMGKEEYKHPEERFLSNKIANRLVHKLRSESDGILIGTNTALIDNPNLDTRFWEGTSPTPILIDKTLKVPLHFNIFKPGRNIIVFNEIKDEVEGNIKYIKLDFDKTDKQIWNEINEKLLESGINSVLIEGGSHTIQSFINSGLPCKLYHIITKKIWHNGIKAPRVKSDANEHFYLGDNLIKIYVM